MGINIKKDGKLIIDEEAAENIKSCLYLRGQSVLGVIRVLEERKILSFIGK